MPKPSKDTTPAEVIQTPHADPATADTSKKTKKQMRGPEVIASYLKTLPNAPGVYRMINQAGDVIYVGKARSLKNRVANYTRYGGHTNRIARMIAATAQMEFVTVKTEAEALLLEANLIKRFKPRFNVLLRDDKSFPYILIARDHDAPQILKHRGARNRKGDYFGPFASAGAVNRTIHVLQRAFLLRSCSDSVYESRTRPCLLYQIKRCAAPCTGEISIPDYNKLVDEAETFLKGDSHDVRKLYQALMEDAAEKLEYERAAEYRNRLTALAHVTSGQSISTGDLAEADIFAAHQEGGHTCIQVFFFRTGQNWGNRAYYPKADKSFGPEEVLASFIAQFYDDKPVPRLILVSHDFEDRGLLSEALTTKSGRKVEILAPKRGEKQKLVEHARLNAREALGRKLAESASQVRLLSGLAERFSLEGPPQRIEVFDNSHISGTNAVGAMIVAGPEGFAKNQYRKFNIKTKDISSGDDYAMMREVLTRRFKRLLTSDQNDEDKNQSTDQTENATNVPDLVLLDGGAGQLSVATEVLGELGLEDRIALVAVAKGPDRNAGREHFYKPGDKTPIMLEVRDPVLYFIQRLRDEAHRFAIGTHRAKRKRAISANPLDEISGVGPTRKRALLRHFGSAKAVSRASVEDLAAIEGISIEMAERIYAFFHDLST